MQTERILNNDLTILMSRSNEGKTILLCNLIESYKKRFNGDVYSFGLNSSLVKTLNIKPFNSLLELEKIRNSIVVIDECANLFDLENRKLRKQIERILRLVNHNGNKLLMSGISSDFKKFICAKAKCFLFKGLNISDMINGSLAKEILTQYRGDGVGVYSFELDKDKVLGYDGSYFTDKLEYKKEFDTKKDNLNLFKKR